MASDINPFNQIQNYHQNQTNTSSSYFIPYKIPEITRQHDHSLQSTVTKVSPKKKKRGELCRQVVIKNYQSSLALNHLFNNSNNNSQDNKSQEGFEGWSWNGNWGASTSANLAKNTQEAAQLIGIQQETIQKETIQDEPAELQTTMQVDVSLPSSLFAGESPTRIFEIFSSAVSSSHLPSIKQCIQQAKEQSLHMYQLLNSFSGNSSFVSSLRKMLANFESMSHDKTEFTVTSQYEYAQLYTHAYFSLHHEKAPAVEYMSKKKTGCTKSIFLDKMNKIFFIFLKKKSSQIEYGSSKIVTDTIKVGFDGSVDTTYVLLRNLPGVTITKQEINYLKSSPGVLHSFEYPSKHGVRQAIIQQKADGNLTLFEATEKKPLLSLDQIEHILHQLARQLFVLHSGGICHGDIKLENILFRKHTFECWITDFGAAFNTDKGELPVIRGVPSYGTVRYTAPEILCSPREFSNMKARDMYALGIALHELLIGEAPWMAHIVRHMYYCPEQETSEHLSQAMREQSTMLHEYNWLLEKQEQRGWIPTQREGLQFIMMSLLHFDPNKRMNASSLMGRLLRRNNSQ